MEGGSEQCPTEQSPGSLFAFCPSLYLLFNIYCKGVGGGGGEIGGG